MVFEPTMMRSRESKVGQIFDLQSRAVIRAHMVENNKYKNQYEPPQRDQDVPPHGHSVKECLWPDLTWLFLCAGLLEVQLFAHKPVLAVCFQTTPTPAP